MKQPKPPKHAFCLRRLDSAPAVDISNRSRRSVPSSEIFRRLILFVLRTERVRQARISLQLVDDRLMKKLNSLFKGRQRTTDVLCFDLAGRSSKNFVFADVVISVETAYQKARELSLSPEEEMFRYAIHGCLHLLNYDDAQVRQRRRMWKRQEELLRKFLKS